MVPYKTSLYVPLTCLFETYSIDFAGPLLARIGSRNRCILIAVEHLTGWPFATAVESTTAQMVIDFVEKEITLTFGPPVTMISDNATCFTSGTLVDFLKMNSISWGTILAYAPMSNGRAEHMGLTVKSTIKKMVIGHGDSWEDLLPKVLFEYSRRRLLSGFSPFELMFGVPPRLVHTDATSALTNITQDHRVNELLAFRMWRAGRIMEQLRRQEQMGVARGVRFQVGDWVLVAHGQSLSSTVKWPVLTSQY